ncbi:MAG: hypothetical protein HY901_24670 [Deltaproteobacteria bacterium]|nr:hypothetical protein [Deltaproteobacteria bacterium]
MPESVRLGEFAAGIGKRLTGEDGQLSMSSADFQGACREVEALSVEQRKSAAIELLGLAIDLRKRSAEPSEKGVLQLLILTSLTLGTREQAAQLLGQ